MPSSYAVGEHFEQFIKELIDGGRYASASEVVREALRLLEKAHEQHALALKALRNDVSKGLASGRGKSARVVLDRLERKYTKKVEERRKK